MSEIVSTVANSNDLNLNKYFFESSLDRLTTSVGLLMECNCHASPAFNALKAHCWSICASLYPTGITPPNPEIINYYFENPLIYKANLENLPLRIIRYYSSGFDPNQFLRGAKAKLNFIFCSTIRTSTANALCCGNDRLIVPKLEAISPPLPTPGFILIITRVAKPNPKQISSTSKATTQFIYWTFIM